MHPSKNCLALQVGDNILNILFITPKSAEELRLTFSKAKNILAFSFLFGEKFNFFIVTDNSLDLYKI